MAGFSQEPNYDFLKGIELTQIRVNPGNVDFVFVQGPVINVHTEFHHFRASTQTTATYQVVGEIKNFAAQWLLGLHTTEAQIVSDDLLKLMFENGDTLSLVRMNDGYESMTIWGHPGGVIVIY